MKQASLIGRVMLVVLLAELLCAVALSGTALLHERWSRLHAFDVVLQGRSDSLLGAIQDVEDPNDNVAIDPAELSLPREDVYAVYSPEGRLLGQSGAAPAALTRQGRDGFSNRSVRGAHYRVYQREAVRVIDRAEHGGVGLRRPVIIVYAGLTNHIWHEVLEAAGFYVLVSLALLTLTAVAMLLLLRRVLQPIRELAAEASSVSLTSLHFRAPASALRVRELQPLAATMTAAIGNLRHALESEQRFVSDAAHELKTAVAVVRSTIQVLMMRTRPVEEYEAGLDRLLEDNVRVEELVARMLTLARLEEGEDTPVESADMGEEVLASLRRLASFAEAHSVELVKDIASGVPVPITPEKVDVLVSNLVVNAVQHSHRGGRVEVSVSLPEDGTMLRVRDYGSGISAEALPHLFERFFREDTSRSRETGGAGLGLPICKSIVEAAKGSITVDSHPGAGTTVLITFARESSA